MIAPLVITLSLGCATAVDDGLGGTLGGVDASGKDSHVGDAGGFDTSTGIDSSTRTDSTTTSLDTGSAKDSGSGIDTAVEEDTYVEDTEPPPIDTYVPPGGPCDWCLEGSCSVPDEDFDCFYKCVFLEGHWDCRYDKSMSPVCLCTD